MAFVDRYDAAIGIFLERKLRSFHTNIRGRVIGVNYAGPSVDVQPFAYTEFDNGVVDKFPPIYDVPLQLPSGSGGKARLSMPIKTGDVVGLSFSERNESDNTDVTTHQLFPGWAISQIFTDSNAKPIDPDNVVLENDKAIATLKPNGDMSLKNPLVTIESLADGNYKVTNGAGTFTVDPSGSVAASNSGGGFTLMPSGQFMCNGAQITPNGKIITANGIDLDDFFNHYREHDHGGVERGGGRTDPPTGV